MSEEAYVSNDTAKLLEKKGFDCASSYSTLIRKEGKDFMLCPSQSVVCRWLREQHKIFISIGIGTDVDDVFGYMPEIYFLDALDSDVGMYGPNVDTETICDFTPQTYEEAVEAALKYVLTNLI